MLLIWLVFCVVFLGGSMLLTLLVFCVVFLGGIYVVHLVRFLCCFFRGSMLLILLVFCVVFFCLEGEGGYLYCSSCKFSVLCFGDVYIAHLVSFLCYVFLGVMGVYFTHLVSFL